MDVIYCSNYRNFFYADAIYRLVDPDPLDELTKSALYAYHKSNPNVSILNNLFCVENLNMIKRSGPEIIFDFYLELINGNHIDIIDEIIDGSNSLDEKMICCATIKLSNYDLLEKLISAGFPLNQHIIGCKFEFIHPMHLDPLGVAVYLKHLSVCKFLVDHGANPFWSQGYSMLQACIEGSYEIFNFFMEMDVPEHYLYYSLGLCCRYFNRNKVSSILNKGIDLRIGPQQKTWPNTQIFTGGLGPAYEYQSNIKTSIIKNCNAEALEFLSEHGLELNDNFFGIAICSGSGKFKKNIRDNANLLD